MEDQSTTSNGITLLPRPPDQHKPDTDEPAVRSSKTTHPLIIPAPALATSRYNRQLLVPSIGLRGQTLLSTTSVLIIGLGGLGSPASLYLASAGIGKLGFVDGDTVEESNLHRQIVHAESRVGMSKIASAIEGCRAINHEVEYLGYEERLSPENVMEIMTGYDVVLDCTDNPATRYLISDACVLLGKTLVSGAAQRVEGQMMTLNYPVPATDGEVGSGRGPCYRCVFPRPPPPDMVRGCSEIGVLGPVVGAVGTLMATECIKVIVKGKDYGRGRKSSMLLYNAWSEDARNMFRTVELRGRRKGCVACGDEDALQGKGETKLTRRIMEEGRMDYVAFCGVLEDVKLLQPDQRRSPERFAREIETGGGIVIDVREENEFEIGAKVKNSINIPISRILRDPEVAFGELMNDRTPEGKSAAHNTYFVCQRGNDSQIAAKRLQDVFDKDQGMNQSAGWVGDINGGFVAMEKDFNVQIL